MSALDPVTVDGSLREGGGQIIRASLSLAFLSPRPLTVHSIRANRPKPGLANQHRAGIQLSAKLSNLSLIGDGLKSTQFTATPRSLPPPSHPPTITCDAITAGACTLIIQGALPPLLFCAATNPTIQILGGTDVPFAPPLAHTQQVLAPLLAKMGAAVTVDAIERTFNPDKGEVHLTASLAHPTLTPLDLQDVGEPVSVTATIVADAATGEAFKTELEELLKATPKLADITPTATLVSVAAPSSKKKRRTQQLSAQLVVTTTTGCLLSANCLSTPAATLVASLTALLATQACVDEHTADQLVVYACLADGTSRIKTPPTATLTSRHLETVIHFATLMTGAKVEVSEAEDGSGCRIVTVEGIGAKRK